MTIDEKIKEHKKAIEILNEMKRVKEMFEVIDNNYYINMTTVLEAKHDDVLTNLLDKVF